MAERAPTADELRGDNSAVGDAGHATVQIPAHSWNSGCPAARTCRVSSCGQP
jgi:hypothetical protein